MTKQDILNTRLWRHHLVPQLSDESAYVELFRQLQPVSTVHNTRPGAPPSLVPRTTFDDKKLTDSLRGSGELVKGRFLGGNIGYVLAGDLHIYAHTFHRPLDGINEYQRLALSALRSCGPLTPRQIKEETGLLNREIMPALHRLQKAFVVFEDQSDSDWERSWFLFEEEWPEAVPIENQRSVAAREVLSRFLKINVFATFEQIRDWSRLPVGFLKTLITAMQNDAVISAVAVDGVGEGYVLSEDAALRGPSPGESVLMLHRADPLIRLHASYLTRLFGKQETLQYLLVDGEIKGAVQGHWRIGPHDVEDVAVLLPQQERRRRREEILSVVSQVYSPPHSNVLSYCGDRLS